MRGAHAVFVEVAAVCLPFALQVAGGDGDLILRGADHSVISDPVGLALEEDVIHGVCGIAAVCHFFEKWQMLFPAAAGIGKLHTVVVTDVGDVAGVKEGSVVSELRQFVAVAETARLVAHVAGKSESFAGR